MHSVPIFDENAARPTIIKDACTAPSRGNEAKPTQSHAASSLTATSAPKAHRRSWIRITGIVPALVYARLTAPDASQKYGLFDAFGRRASFQSAAQAIAYLHSVSTSQGATDPETCRSLFPRWNWSSALLFLNRRPETLGPG